MKKLTLLIVTFILILSGCDQMMESKYYEDDKSGDDKINTEQSYTITINATGFDDAIPFYLIVQIYDTGTFNYNTGYSTYDYIHNFSGSSKANDENYKNAEQTYLNWTISDINNSPIYFTPGTYDIVVIMNESDNIIENCNKVHLATEQSINSNVELNIPSSNFGYYYDDTGDGTSGCVPVK